MQYIENVNYIAIRIPHSVIFLILYNQLLCFTRIKMSREESLEWITDFLELKDIPYLICGGLAAIAYGSHRPLYDIDLYVPEKNYMMVVKFGRKYITYGPERLINEHWNVNYVQFNFKGQKIEVGSSKNLHIYDSTKQE